MKVYGLIQDNGDGSSSIRWFTDIDVVEEMLDGGYEYQEYYYANEGSPAVVLDLPDSITPESIGIRLD